MVVPRVRSVTPLGHHRSLGPIQIEGNPTPGVAERLGAGWPSGAHATPTAVTIRIGEVAPRPLTLGIDESYRLTIDVDGIELRAATDVGARRGVETLLQLAHDDSGCRIEHATIDDAPKFPWRGVLIDPCRHWIGVDTLLETIDALAAAKFNVLHLHLSDDQAFRLESRRWPELHRLGSDGNFFTHHDIARIVDHASAAGVRVVPELDLPGHVTSWLVGYPQLAATPGPFELRSTVGIATVALDPHSAEVSDFIEALLSEIVDLFPDQYLHIGGDEVSPEAWPDLDVVSTQRRFTTWATDLVRRLGRVPVVWDEAWHPDLAPDVVTQVWRGHRRLRIAAGAHQPVLFSTPYYLDLGYDPAHHHVDPLVDATSWDASRRRLHDDPRLSTWGPIAAAVNAEFEGTELAPTDVDPTTVLGGEACMWSELVTEPNLSLRLWPTAAAVADVLWSGGGGPGKGGPGGDSGDLHDRLEAFSRHLAATTTIDVAEVRRRRWLELAGGDEVLADAISTLAGCCEPSKWYSRHAALPGGLVEQSFDRFVDALPPVAADPTASDTTAWRAAAELILGIEQPSERVGELWPLARELLAVCDGQPTDLIESRGEVLVTARREGTP